MLTDRDLKILKNHFKAWIREVMEEQAERPIGAAEAAKLVGYKNASSIVRNAKVWGGYQATPGGRWVFSYNDIMEKVRAGWRPPVEFRR